MFTYFLIGAAAVLVVAAVVYQVLTWNRPGRHISQNAPMDDAMMAEARRQHDIHRGAQTSGGGPS